MTIQVDSREHQASKDVLRKALNSTPMAVRFYNPSPFNDGQAFLTGDKIAPGSSFPVVMDPLTRRRFAKVTRRADGTFRVE